MRRNLLAVAVSSFISLTGVMHFASPSFFNDIVPPWLPFSNSFWTYASGLAEIIVGGLILRPSTRKWGGYALIALLIAVYPANLYMTWDWRNRSGGEQFISWARLPLQFVMIAVALRIARSVQPKQLN